MTHKSRVLVFNTSKKRRCLVEDPSRDRVRVSPPGKPTSVAPLSQSKG